MAFVASQKCHGVFGARRRLECLRLPASGSAALNSEAHKAVSQGMATAGATRPGSVYGLLVGLGAEAAGASRALLAAKVVTKVAAHFGAAAVTLHPTTEGWAEAFSDPPSRASACSTAPASRPSTRASCARPLRAMPA
jgi:hypothetical protein